jgi:Asp-tRNA(Asn)/Glu-tRNA(Gln) amidotransferase A subunit family amidase
MSAANELSAAEALARLGSGALTAEELVRACLDRADECNR